MTTEGLRAELSAAAAWQRRAAEHRAHGRPRAAEQAYRFAASAFDDAGDQAAAADVRADYRALLVELGRDKEAAELDAPATG